jgi:hypothetical protein
MSAVVASRPAWRTAMQSELEVLVLREIERQQLPRPVESHRDKHRDLRAASIGWLPMRLTDLDVNGGLPAAIRAVGQALSRR